MAKVESYTDQNLLIVCNNPYCFDSSVDDRRYRRRRQRGDQKSDVSKGFLEIVGVVTARDIADGTATSTTVAASNDR